MGRCKFLIGGPEFGGPVEWKTDGDQEFYDQPFSKAGYVKAVRLAQKLAKKHGRPTTIGLLCGHGTRVNDISIARCSSDGCIVVPGDESMRSDSASHETELAAVKLTHEERQIKKSAADKRAAEIAKKLGLNKPKRKSKPLSSAQIAAQKRFKAATQKCKGKPGYRECIAATLGKKK